ncbi:hypothetical protein PL373_19115 [Tenacibaculum maritimum]|nr:hypothetical protein [Tenacibaculum maritimum]MDB0603200.1 hypothetical protein [Tenacibaculum maritimum]MDB0610462.1 hypothetical protein [Tenacibaculum maritimum]
MNYTKFDQVGGFPLETETLSKMQEAYNIFQAFGDLVGTKSIVKGCIQAGSNISDGVIYWDGELLPFVAGGIQSKIVIVEEVTNVEFEDGDIKPTYFKRYATFGTGTAAVLWTEFKRAYPLTSALYIDKVDMFAGDLANIPAGWHLCDGQNGTADLRGKFIVGYNPADIDNDAVGKTGGEKEVTLTEAQMPSHKHTGSTSSAGNHKHNLSIGKHHRSFDGENASDHPYKTNAGIFVNLPTDFSGNHTHSLTINNKGGDQAHENRPPFYTLAYIQFKGL